jgi:hypothetical protein
MNTIKIGSNYSTSDEDMNEISIIINGVRYDSTADSLGNICNTCDLQALCDSKSVCVSETCVELLGEGYNFKKSTKSFER